jgi:hypothetical protein
MSKSDILEELPRFALAERREILDRLFELEENDLLGGGEPSAEEKAVLDRELEDYQQNASIGSPWRDVESRVRKEKT